MAIPIFKNTYLQSQGRILRYLFHLDDISTVGGIRGALVLLLADINFTVKLN